MECECNFACVICCIKNLQTWVKTNRCRKKYFFFSLRRSRFMKDTSTISTALRGVDIFCWLQRNLRHFYAWTNKWPLNFEPYSQEAYQFWWLFCTQAGGRCALSWPRVRPGWLRWLVDLKSTTGIKDNVLFLFTFKSGSVLNRRPSPLPEHGLFISVFLPGWRRYNGDAGFEDKTMTNLQAPRFQKSVKKSINRINCELCIICISGCVAFIAAFIYSR